MKRLIVMRHAKSSWGDWELADHDRPLNPRGKRDAPRMGKLLRNRDWTPDLIMSSTAKRARKTAVAVAEGAGYAAEVVLTREFYHAAPQVYLDAAVALDDTVQTVMFVGHNPGMGMLVEALSGTFETMPTATVAVFVLDVEQWADWDGETAQVEGIFRPKELPNP